MAYLKQLFINGIKDRIQVKQLKDVDFSEFDKLFGIEEEQLLHIPMHNWLDPDKN
ncbi:hypothetical protein [Vagococcus fluvialis]|uniref:hypothetical protein n=1 Tax=Vagococcus fluvialis TaxID=2738 RepID=UPI003B2248BF